MMIMMKYQLGETFVHTWYKGKPKLLRKESKRKEKETPKTKLLAQPNI